MKSAFILLVGLTLTYAHKCAPECPDGWLGDGQCDPKCNVATCDYDKGDCKATSLLKTAAPDAVASESVPVSSSASNNTFTLTDYLGEYKRSRDAYMKARERLKLARGPYRATRNAFEAASKVYNENLI